MPFLGASAAVALGMLFSLAFDPALARVPGAERDQASQRLTVREWTVTLVRAVRGLGESDTHTPVVGVPGDGSSVPRVSAVVVAGAAPAEEALPAPRLRVEMLNLPPPPAA